MPPYERNGNQPMVVDRDGNNFASHDYLALREKAALAGSVYQPILGFSTVRNVGAGRKYPFDPFYAGFSPRVSAAWNLRSWTNGIFAEATRGSSAGSTASILSRFLCRELVSDRRSPASARTAVDSASGLPASIRQLLSGLEPMA